MQKQPSLRLEDIKKWVIIALASDDLLMQTLVLKGGNAIDLLRTPGGRALSRASYDLDFSMEEDFEGDLVGIATRIQTTLANTFFENGFMLFDFSFMPRPKHQNEELKDFWGGYKIEFKLITAAEFNRLGGDIEKLRRQALAIRPNQSTRVEIEISKYEYVAPKMTMILEGHPFFIYSPAMIVFEKLRAICQQLPAYAAIIPSHSPRPRARDFYDIHLIGEQHPLDPAASASHELAEHIFGAKKVPIAWIRDIAMNSAIHRQDWQNVLDTLPAGERLEVHSFDFYLQYVVDKFLPLTSR